MTCGAAMLVPPHACVAAGPAPAFCTLFDARAEMIRSPGGGDLGLCSPYLLGPRLLKDEIWPARLSWAKPHIGACHIGADGDHRRAVPGIEIVRVASAEPAEN